ncbi:uncharacterized protein LTR77_003891 [Saxophila tyrrhenica]|uniref:Uncharacterized protein n=1 Tax=Saxophila tyrrhenica TaxID=1690608 RepID=A0AAV9PEX0_9PEZI|nr:hypothetical protein LTR77_003891 [Saxophila tyrrhenica]
MHLSLLATGLLGLAAPALAGKVTLQATANDANPSQDRCYAILENVNGCSGTSEPFCSNLLGLQDGCGSCNGVKSKEVCGSAAVSMNFDTGEFKFANENPGQEASCHIDPAGGTCMLGA